MKIALGLRAHSGWAALVALAPRGDELELIDRRRIDLVDEADLYWAKQPYHAADGLEPDEARALVKRGIASARRLAVRELRAAAALARAAQSCELGLVAIPEKQLAESAERALGMPAARLAQRVAALGKAAGPPWGKDQKDAALAAWIALSGKRPRQPDRVQS